MNFRIFDTKEALENIKSLEKIKSGEFMFSLDIEAMYPSIPTDKKALDIIEAFITKHEEGKELFGFKLGHIMKFIEFIFSNNYIENEGKYYKQIEGLGTGACASPMIGDILVDNMYMAVIHTTNLEPNGLALYVHDSWGIWQ